tara:strand:- start:403 stop:708 length:306 start_codon:yes stop_codon:yes gene_type:complete
MAKKSWIARNKKRTEMAERQAPVRTELRKLAIDPKLSEDERQAARTRLSKLPRNGAKCRIISRCSRTGRSHAVYRKFGLSRIAFRELALKGYLPGITKASW